MQDTAKFIIPAALIATTLGAAVAYSYHSPARTMAVAVVPETAQPAPAGTPAQSRPIAASEAIDASWKQWHPLTDF